jgi:hypothetical protein
MSDSVAVAFSNLLRQTSPSAKEVRALLRQARDPDYWRQLNPKMSLSGTTRMSDIRHTPPDEARYNHAVEHMRAYGYFQFDRIYSIALMRKMRSALETVRDAGWPAVFSMVYDEFWLVVCVPWLVRLLEDALGPGYQQIPHVWCHYINPVDGAHGWAPHVDGDSDQRYSVWIPLSDATLDNGCIYLIPDGRAPNAGGREFLKRKRYTMAEGRRMIQAMRAMPAPAGSVLGWHFGMVHWGTRAADGKEPRISVAYEFISKSAKPKADELPLIETHTGIPTFERRLEVIGQALRDYIRFEPLMARHHEIALELCRR